MTDTPTFNAGHLHAPKRSRDRIEADLAAVRKELAEARAREAGLLTMQHTENAAYGKEIEECWSKAYEAGKKAALAGGDNAVGDEIERLRAVIDCGCNAIRDAIAVSGGDLERIDAVQRRMRREMTMGDDDGGKTTTN